MGELFSLVSGAALSGPALLALNFKKGCWVELGFLTGFLAYTVSK